MEFKTIDIQGFEGALSGMRNPLKSYHKADSFWADESNFVIGPNDYKLAKNL